MTGDVTGAGRVDQDPAVAEHIASSLPATRADARRIIGQAHEMIAAALLDHYRCGGSRVGVAVRNGRIVIERESRN